MRITVISATVAMLALVACGGSQPRTNEPYSQTTTTGVSAESGPASPGDPSAIAPNEGATSATSGSVASPMEGACPEGEPRGAAMDRVSCLKSCRGQDDTVPLGSKCLSQYESCALKCDEKFMR